MCDVYLAARQAQVLNPTQRHVAEACELLVRGLAQVGIVALIDEVTSFQEVRDRRALQAILDQYLRQEFAVWAKRFPDEFYKQMFRLRNWTWKGMNPANGPRVIAKYTKDLVYARLTPGIVTELEERNPVLVTNRREAKHHQFLSDEVGHVALSRHLHAVTAIMRGSRDWDGFMTTLDLAFPKQPQPVKILRAPDPTQPADGPDDGSDDE